MEPKINGVGEGMVEYIIVPNNTSLVSYVGVALKSLGMPKSSRIIKSRGEDIPLIVEEFFKKGINAIGMTGRDLLKEYQLFNENTKLSVIKMIPWVDKKAMFGKPVLCLLGPKGRSMKSMPKQLRICINSKYKYLAAKYLNQLEIKDYKIEKIFLSGSTEASYTSGLADLVIEIVYTGASIEEAGLDVYDKIYESDFVVIGVKSPEEISGHPRNLVNFSEQ